MLKIQEFLTDLKREELGQLQHVRVDWEALLWTVYSEPITDSQNSNREFLITFGFENVILEQDVASGLSQMGPWIYKCYKPWLDGLRSLNLSRYKHELFYLSSNYHQLCSAKQVLYKYVESLMTPQPNFTGFKSLLVMKQPHLGYWGNPYFCSTLEFFPWLMAVALLLWSPVGNIICSFFPVLPYSLCCCFFYSFYRCCGS